MAIRAEAVDILVRKGRFEPEVALGIAEAIEVANSLSQLVTIPDLDARLQDLKHEIKDDIQMLAGEMRATRTELEGESRSTRTELEGEIRAIRT